MTISSDPSAPTTGAASTAAVPQSTATVPGNAIQNSMAASSGDQCPSCGGHMATDQRYCLECGHRRGDPRLPFMDAVIFMDAAKRPPQAAPPPSPPREHRPRISANTSLVAGVATLVLAIGVGVLIGRSGGSGSTTAVAPPPQIIKVGGGETATATAANKGAVAKGGKSKKTKAPEKTIDSSGTSEAAAEVLKPAGDVKLPPPTVQPGGECESGAAGCNDGKFTGDFFGE